MRAPYPDILDLANGRGDKYRADCAAFDAEFRRMCHEDTLALYRLFYAGRGSATMPHSGMRVTWESETAMTWWRRFYTWANRRGRRADWRG